MLKQCVRNYHSRFVLRSSEPKQHPLQFICKTLSRVSECSFRCCRSVCANRLMVPLWSSVEMIRIGCSSPLARSGNAAGCTRNPSTLFVSAEADAIHLNRVHLMAWSLALVRWLMFISMEHHLDRIAIQHLFASRELRKAVSLFVLLKGCKV